MRIACRRRTCDDAVYAVETRRLNPVSASAHTRVSHNDDNSYGVVNPRNVAVCLCGAPIVASRTVTGLVGESHGCPGDQRILRYVSDHRARAGGGGGGLINLSSGADRRPTGWRSGQTQKVASCARYCTYVSCATGGVPAMTYISYTTERGRFTYVYRHAGTGT